MDYGDGDEELPLAAEGPQSAEPSHAEAAPPEEQTLQVPPHVLWPARPTVPGDSGSSHPQQTRDGDPELG